MESAQHTLKDLFDQLGLPSSPADIEAFAAKTRPLPAAVRLADAPCWTPSQAALLREEIAEDADWAEVVDQLNLMLR